ncbi:cation-translocating P-type ATPase [Garciella nitratireducens]|uniref:cation-translocating P-type ATPase n=1 Tax=Garciella nitratireducens TaxID=218205 RepID=UPI000DE946BE|nr:cation-translocating P-type ATPase [Garciella nitratireducens]RBP44680.1 calcium-translocating P-type ATPase [Garciella nitratireducens]
MDFYRKSKEETLETVQTTMDGLTNNEVQQRLEKDGYNELKDTEKVSTWKLFLETFKDPMVIVLLIVAGVQVILGEVVESLIIFLVLILNAVISVVQTKKAEGSLEALKNMSAPSAKVIRNGTKQTIPARELVQGDIVLLEAGDYVPADGRILESASLKVNEGMLTGESEAVEKHTNIIPDEVALGDRKNIVFSGSLVVYGHGTFVVTGTAEKTEIGKIADMLATAEAKQTPLQRKLDAFSKKLGVAILILCIFIFALEAGRIWLGDSVADTGTAILNALMFAVAVAVAAIPEALSAIVTIVLSVGTNKMAKQNAIIRKLYAVETLGSASVIATDKTGTLTQNKMTVVDYFIPGEADHTLDLNPKNWNQSQQMLMNIAVLCNDSYINNDGQEIGDPTEVALIQFSNKNNKDYQELRDTYNRETELPFDSDRKLMSTVNRIDGKKMILTKGGPDVMFGRAEYVLINGKEESLTEERLDQFVKANEDFSNQALRVLAYGYRVIPEEQNTIDETDEYKLVLVGLTAMIDPPREEVYEAIKNAKSAGIKTVMITGDHKTTAQAIGRDIGLMDQDDFALSGPELDAMTDTELDEKLEHISVYARVSPENKIRIVRAWQRKGKVTAMTGDGVNDAPALKQADIGVAMGTGTDVAKDAAAMILTDDNFASIVKAVSVGRTVYENIKKAISYLFAGNLGAIIAILYAVLFNLPNPFTALQLLFINLVNDSLPAIALGMQKAEPNTMKKKPRDPKEGLFAGGTFQAVAVRGTLIGIAVIVSFYIGLSHSDEMGVAMAFTTLILSRTLQTFAARSNTQTSISAGFFSNKPVIGAVLLGFVLYGLTVLPFTRGIFGIPAAFGLREFGIAIGLAILAVILMEIVKVFRNKFNVGK